MPAIPSKVFAKMLQQMPHDAPRLFGHLNNLPDAVDIVALAHFEAFDQLLFEAEMSVGGVLMRYP